MQWAPTICGAAFILTATVAHALDEHEQRARIEYEASEGSRAIEQLGAIYPDVDLQAYLQGVVDKLYPDQIGKMRVRPFKSDNFNAFALANGDLYFNIGTLLRLDNEAELASVLGHEGAHYTRDHIYRQIKDAKVSMPVLTVLGTALGAPALGQLAGVSSILGMSREHERDADHIGHQQLVLAGYDPSAGAASFRRLLGEIDLLKLKQPFFFASHPRVQERIANFELLSKNKNAGALNRDIYNGKTERARLDALRGIAKSGNGKLLVYLLDAQNRLETLPGYCRFYLAEGLRLRKESGDAERALSEYQRVLATDPDFAPTYAALGRRYMQEGDAVKALTFFRRFLKLDREATDRAFVEQYVNALEKETSQ